MRKGKVVRHIFRVWRHEAGNVAMMFGLAIVPLIGIAGGAVDLARRSHIEAELQDAVDVAALAAARTIQAASLSGGGSWAERQAQAAAAGLTMFRSNFVAGDGLPAPVPVIDVSGRTVRITADFDMPTSLLAVIGIRSLVANVAAEVVIPDMMDIEIALVLDYSGSMQDNDKYIRMTSAAQDFIARVGSERGHRAKVGIVPFSQYVLATIRGGDLRGVAAADAQDSITACLSNRDYPYSTSGETPYPAISASRWPGIEVAADEHDENACSDYVDGSLQVRGLTDDFSGLSSALSAMHPTGLTNIALASEIGWHVLTPEPPFETAVASTQDHPVLKVLVLLTDGRQTVEAMGPSGAVSVEAANEGTLELCDNMEQGGIRVFTIAYDLEEDAAARALLTACASADGAFHEATTSDISEIFDEIFEQIAKSVWLSG